MIGCILIGALSTAAGTQQAVPVTPPLVFDRVTVVDVEQGGLIPDQRVVIIGNHIQDMGGRGVVKVPADARVVAAQGKYLIPGLWDMHVHPQRYVDIAYPLLIANGVTGIRDAWSWVPLDTLTQWRREILTGTRVGPPRQLLAGAPLQPPCAGDGCDLDSVRVRYLVDSLIAAGANTIKTYRLAREMFFVLAAEARRMGVPFGGHLTGQAPADMGIAGILRSPRSLPSVTAQEASDSGASLIDHPNSSGGLDTLCWGEQGTVERCQQLAERFRRNGTWWVPTLAMAQFINDMTLPRSDAACTRLSERVRALWKTAGTAAACTFTDSRAGAPEVDGILRIAQHAGLPIVAGTDANGLSLTQLRRMPPGLSLHSELEMYVAEGLTPLAALQSATLNPAKMGHATDSLGTIAPGKLADLVLLDADPLADITNTTTIRAVVANGRYFDRAALDQLLTEAQSKASAESEPEP